MWQMVIAATFSTCVRIVLGVDLGEKGAIITFEI